MAIVRELSLPSSGDSNTVNRFRRDGRVCAEEAEYGRTIHRKANDSGPLRRDGEDSRGVG